MARHNRRNKARKPLGKVLHIFFEDKKSSRYYIEGLIKDKGYKSNIIPEVHKHTDPISIVNDAKKIKNNPRTPSDDEYWVVYDAESPRQRAVAEHATAYQNALDCGINIAMSSVSYETWILLHYEYTAAQFNNSSQLERHIKASHQSNYDKADKNIFPKLKDKLSDALQHAESLETHNSTVNYGKKSYEINPYTDFHKLLEAIDDFSINN